MKRQKLLPPDWDRASTTYGVGSIAEISKPHVRMFPRPDGRPREVSIRIHTWIGYGGSHHYVNVWAEPNLVWDGRTDEYCSTGTWRNFRDDPLCEEETCDLDARLDSRQEALDWAERVREKFGKGWEARIDDMSGDLDDRPYVDPREGD